MKKQPLCSILFFFTICFSANVFGQYQINGNASSLGANCFQLNPDLENQVGSVWNKDVLNLNHPFDFTFNVNLGCTNATSGDGICFGLQPLSSGIGVGGNGMGMMGITPSLGVFIDTYENYWDTDPTYDHISLNANGDVDHTTANNLSGPFQASSTNADIEDCSNHKLRVKWDPSAKSYQVWFDDVLRISYTGNIINTIFGGNPNVYWGFTGATGLYHNDQRFCLILAANFSATTVCSGAATAFTDLSNSANPITNWAWDFGDGSPVFSGAAAATYKNPTHVYATAGTYTVRQTITSSAGTSIISHNIVVKPSPVMTATPTSMEFCSGGTTAISLKSSLAATSIAWNASLSGGAVSGYSGGTGTSISQTLNTTGSTAGTVTYNVTGTLNGCTGTVVVPVKVNPMPAVSVNAPSPICNGASATLTASGSPAGGNYSWSPGGATSSSITVSPGSTTTYTVTYTLATSCSKAITTTLTVNPLPTATVTSPSAVCAGTVATLTSTTSPAGGTYAWSTGATTTSISVSPATTTTYTLTYTLGNGCKKMATGTTIITPLQDANFSYSKSTYCGNALDTFPNYIATTPGVFSATPAGLSLNPTTGKISPINSSLNTYAIKYTTSGTCPGTKTVNLTIASNPSADFTYTLGAYCQYTGTVMPVFTGTSSAGTFSAMPSGLVFVSASTGEIDLNKSAPGNYTVKNIIPKNGTCQADTSAPVNIIIKAAPVLMLSSKTQTICSGGTTSISLTGANSYDWTTVSPATITGASDVTGNITGSIAQTLITSDVVPGIVHYLITPHANGCIGKPDSLHIIVNPTPTLTVTPLQQEICSGAQTNIALLSNLPGASFSWTVNPGTVTGASNGSTTVGNIIQTLVNPGVIADIVIYTIIPTSAEGCVGDPIQSKVIVNPRASITFLSSAPVICSGTAISADVFSNVAGTVLTWTPRPSPAIGAKSGSGPSPAHIGDVLSITGDTAVTVLYELTGTSVGGCLSLPLASLLKFTVNPLPRINADFVKINASNCGTLTGSITGLSMISGIAPLKYEWKNNQGMIIGTNLLLNPALPGIYTLKVTDANGCSATIGTDNKLNIQTIKSVTAAFTSDITSGETPLHVQFNNQSTSTGTINYNWDFGNGSTSILKNPSATFDKMKDYTVCLVVDDGVKGCRDTMCSLIETVTTPDLLIVPNVFTPNGDGINDVLAITAKGLETVNAQIYNRWGEKLYEWNTLLGGWDGFTASGMPAPEGTYFIILVASGADKNKTILPPVKQSFTLLR
jgi:gliding motility-associated-like protein